MHPTIPTWYIHPVPPWVYHGVLYVRPVPAMGATSVCVAGRRSPGLKPGNNKGGEALGSLPDVNPVRVVMLFCAELLRFSRKKGRDDRIATG